MNTYDFIIVGGGIAGASAGFAMAEFGTVLLLEREELLKQLDEKLARARAGVGQAVFISGEAGIG